MLSCGGSGVSWNASPLGLITFGSPSRATLATPSYLKLQAPISMLWVGNLGSTLATLGGVCGVIDVAGTVSYYLIYPNGSAFTSIADNSVAMVGTTTAATGACNLIVRFGGSQPSNPSSVEITQYINGTLDAAASPTGTFPTLSYGASTEVYLGSVPSLSDKSDLRHDLFVVWDRFLTATEIAALNSNPWQIFVSPAVPFPAALLPAM